MAVELHIANLMKKPTIVDHESDRRFRKMARAFGSDDPDDLWVGGYVNYEWKRSRYFIQSYVQDPGNKHVLEFGCNVGGTAIVFAHLGAAVTAVDIDPITTALAQANARRYGADIAFAVLHGGPTPLPFDDATFDIVSCNSVLEYVTPPLLAGIAKELGRVLKEGGMVFVMGTSSRLAPREVHSHRWLINYLPLFIDRVVGHLVPLQRGVWPWRIRGYFPGFRDLTLEDRGDAYISARRAAGLATAKVRILRTLIPIVGQVGWSIGMITPSIFLALRKPGAAGDEPVSPRCD